MMLGATGGSVTTKYDRTTGLLLATRTMRVYGQVQNLPSNDLLSLQG